MTGHFPARYAIDGHFAWVPQNEQRGMPDRLATDAPSLPRFLQRAGYRTADYKLAFFHGQPSDESTLGKPSMLWMKEKSFLIEPAPPAWEFCDLKKDPNENRNEYTNPAYAETIRGLKD